MTKQHRAMTSMRMTATATKPLRVLALVLSGTALVGAPAQFTSPAMAQGMPGMGGPLSAGVITLTRQKVPVTSTLTGKATARDTAAIRPLVSGIITEIPHQQGHPVQAGQALFKVDTRSYEAEVTSARAQLQSAEAAVPAAEASVNRAERLLGTGTSQETLDGLRTQLAQARASVMAAEAALDIAELNLERTTITSPIDGLSDIASVSVGDLVTANQAQALSVVTALDPILVDMSEASARMLMVRARIESGEVALGEKLQVALTLENGRQFKGEGQLETVGHSVSSSTGTITMRVRFDNPDRLILPGMFVTAALTFGTADAFLVPQLAASPNADGTLSVWVLDAEKKAREIRVTAEGTRGSAWVISKGLEDGAQLVVDRLDTLVAGTEIAPVPVEINADGVIISPEAAPPTAAPAPTPPTAPPTAPQGEAPAEAAPAPDATAPAASPDTPEAPDAPAAPAPAAPATGGGE